MQCVCAILSSVAYLAVPYFSVLSHKRNDLRVSILSTNMTDIFFILRRTEQDMIKTVYRASCKVAVIVVRF